MYFCSVFDNEIFNEKSMKKTWHISKRMLRMKPPESAELFLLGYLKNYTFFFFVHLIQ